MTDREIMEALLKGETLCLLATYDTLDMYLLDDDIITVSAGGAKKNRVQESTHFDSNWRIKPKPKLTWNEALQAMREGKKVKRACWRSGSPPFCFRDKMLSFYYNDAPAILSVEDLDAIDWMVVE